MPGLRKEGCSVLMELVVRKVYKYRVIETLITVLQQAEALCKEYFPMLLDLAKRGNEGAVVVLAYLLRQDESLREEEHFSVLLELAKKGCLDAIWPLEYLLEKDKSLRKTGFPVLLELAKEGDDRSIWPLEYLLEEDESLRKEGFPVLLELAKKENYEAIRALQKLLEKDKSLHKKGFPVLIELAKNGNKAAIQVLAKLLHQYAPLARLLVLLELAKKDEEGAVWTLFNTFVSPTPKQIINCYQQDPNNRGLLLSILFEKRHEYPIVVKPNKDNTHEYILTLYPSVGEPISWRAPKSQVDAIRSPRRKRSCVVQ